MPFNISMLTTSPCPRCPSTSAPERTKTRLANIHGAVCAITSVLPRFHPDYKQILQGREEATNADGSLSHVNWPLMQRRRKRKERTCASDHYQVYAGWIHEVLTAHDTQSNSKPVDSPRFSVQLQPDAATASPLTDNSNGNKLDLRMAMLLSQIFLSASAAPDPW